MKALIIINRDTIVTSWYYAYEFADEDMEYYLDNNSNVLCVDTRAKCFTLFDGEVDNPRSFRYTKILKEEYTCKHNTATTTIKTEPYSPHTRFDPYTMSTSTSGDTCSNVRMS